MSSNPLAFLQAQLDTLSGLSNDINGAVRGALDELAKVDLTPPAPVLRVVTDFDRLQEALDGAGVIYVPQGAYTMDVLKTLEVRSRTILFFHPAAVIAARPNSLSRYDMLRVEGAEDVQIIGGTLIGDRDTHNYTEGSTHEWGCGLRIRKSRRIYVRETECEELTGDGIMASGQDLTFDRVGCHGNRRQGMSLFTGSNYRIYGGEFSRTGGTKPGAGLDIEPDRGDVVDVVIDGATFEHNTTAGVLAWTRTPEQSGGSVTSVRNLRIRNCTFDSNANGINAKSNSGQVIDILITGNKFNNHKGAGVFAERNTNVTVGLDNKEDANTFVGPRPRINAFSDIGLVTKYDIQTRDNATYNVGLNNYA